MEDLRVKDVSNIDSIRSQSRSAVQDILSILKVASATDVKPSIADLAKFIQPAKQYFSSFKDKRSEVLNFSISAMVAFAVAFLIYNNAFNFSFHFLNEKISVFLNGFIQGVIIFLMLAVFHYFLDKDRSESAYVRAMMGHLSAGDEKYVEPIRQLLFDGLENGAKEKIEYYNWYLVVFLVFLGALLSGLSALNSKLIVLVFFVAFFMWIGDFNFKKIKKEKKNDKQ